MTGLTVYTLHDFIDIFFVGFWIAFILSPFITFYLFLKMYPDFFKCNKCGEKINDRTRA